MLLGTMDLCVIVQSSPGSQAGTGPLRLIFNINSFVCNSAIITSAQPHYRLNTNTLNSDIKHKTPHRVPRVNDLDLTSLQSALFANKEALQLYKIQHESWTQIVVHCLCAPSQESRCQGPRILTLVTPCSDQTFIHGTRGH